MSVVEFSPSAGRMLPVSRLAGAMLLALVAAFAIIGPLVIPGDPAAQTLMKALSAPEAVAPLGYDHLGRSIFHRLASALRLSPLIAIAAVVTAAVAGLALGTRQQAAVDGLTGS